MLLKGWKALFRVSRQWTFPSISDIITNISDGLFHYMFHSIAAGILNFNRPFNHKNTCTSIWNTCPFVFFVQKIFFRCLTTSIRKICFFFASIWLNLATESPGNWIVSTKHSYFCEFRHSDRIEQHWGSHVNRTLFLYTERRWFGNYLQCNKNTANTIATLQCEYEKGKFTWTEINIIAQSFCYHNVEQCVTTLW